MHDWDWRLATLKPLYEELFRTCQIRKSWLAQILLAVECLSQGRKYHENLGQKISLPWWFVGIVDYRATIDLPVEAILALQNNAFDLRDRSIPAWLCRFKALNSNNSFDLTESDANPDYLWAGSNHFTSNSQQGLELTDQPQKPGAATLLWYLFHKGTIDLPDLESKPSRANHLGLVSALSNTTPSPHFPVAVTPKPAAAIQVLDAFKYYQKLPHQDAAIAWLHEQQSDTTLNEFAHRWRLAPAIPLELPTPPLSLKVLSDTIFKASPNQAYTLTDSEKVLVKAGTEFKAYTDEPAPGKHVKVKLANATLSPDGRNTWYIFANHVDIEGTEPDNHPDDHPDPALIKISPIKTGPLRLPGYDSTFYLSDPILPKGHFSWAEATKNGTRIPVNKGVVEGILKIAEAMEEVRDYLGDHAITVNSWYRDPISNRQVGGASRLSRLK